MGACAERVEDPVEKNVNGEDDPGVRHSASSPDEREVSAVRTLPRLPHRDERRSVQSRVGKIIHDTYRVERLIASGGMGAVYEVMHLRLAHRFVLKVLDHALARNDEAYVRFRQEAEIAAALQHPNIVQLIDFNHDENGNPFIVMEFVDGPTLDAYLEGRALSLREALRLLEPLLHALDAAHRAGVVHRDIKPHNIMVRKNHAGVPEPKLLDFGISKMRDGEEGMTAENIVMGTPNYMSPEQARGQTKCVDGRTDIFAVGAILYEMLSGRRAFDQRTTPDVLHAIVYGEPPSLSKVRPDLPDEVSAFVARCMAKSLHDRFASVRDVLCGLRELARPRPSPPASPSSTPGPRVWGLLGWFFSLALLGFVGVTWQLRKPLEAETPAAGAISTPSGVSESGASPRSLHALTVATPGAMLLEDGASLYRADVRGLTLWTDADAVERTRALPSVSAVSTMDRGEPGEIVVGQADGTLSSWDADLQRTRWTGRVSGPVVGVARAGEYMGVATEVHLALLNGRTGQLLKRFEVESPIIAMVATKLQPHKLLVLRRGALDVFEPDARRKRGETPMIGTAVALALEEAPGESPVVVVDFDQGTWMVRRRYRLLSDRRGVKWWLDPLGSERL